jgi:endonuclease YncB( thermonuclease family)
MVSHKSVSVDSKGLDRYGCEGFARHFKTYSKVKALAQLEIGARTAKRGLRSQSDALPPWEYRKQ